MKTWFFLLLKRLYKKPTFLAILLLIPLLTFGYGVIAREDSGVLTVALASQDPADPMAQKIITYLQGGDSLLHFVPYADAYDAKEAVTYGKADSAWIFEDDLQNKVYAFLAKPTKANAFVQVLERTPDLTARLAREKLTGAVLACTAVDFYIQYVRENLPELSHTTDEALQQYYDETIVSGKLFEYAQRSEEAGNYLLTPVRGLLSVVTCLCGLSAALYYTVDTQKGTFAWVPEGKRIITELSCQAVAVGNVAVISLLALLFSGLAGALWRELLLLPIYVLSVCLFSMTVRRLLPGLRLLGMATPLLIVGMLVLCPVFLNLGALRQFQIFFPPSFYIHGVYSPIQLLYLVLYCIVTALFCVLFDQLTHR